MTTTKIKLGDLSPKDKPWDTHRRQAVSITDYYAAGGNYPQYGDRVNGCSRWLEFHLTDSSIKLSKAYFCRVRYCPVCQWRRTMMWKARAFAVIPKLVKEHPTARYLFMTLTVKNVNISDLRLSIKEINYGFRKMTMRKDWPGLGHIKSLEVTKGKDGPMQAHPHMHILVMVKPSYFWARNYVSQERWTEIWMECMKLDYVPQVNIKAIKGDIEQGVKETIKYEAKPDELVSNGAEWLEALTQQTKKMRRIELAGLLRQYFRELEEEPEDLINVDEDATDEPTTGDDLRFDWSRPDGAYLLNNDDPA